MQQHGFEHILFLQVLEEAKWVIFYSPISTHNEVEEAGKIRCAAEIVWGTGKADLSQPVSLPVVHEISDKS